MTAHLVAGLVSEAHNLVLNGRTVPRAHSINPAAIDRRLVQVVPYELVCGCCCTCEVAIQLRPLNMLLHKPQHF